MAFNDITYCQCRTELCLAGRIDGLGLVKKEKKEKKEN